MPIQRIQGKGSIPNPVQSLKQQGARIFSDSSAFPVNIQSGANDIFTLNTSCSVNTRIRQLKDIIINERGLENGQNFTLKYNGNVMENHQTLGSYNINDYRHLILMVYHVGAPMQVQSNNVAVAIRDDTPTNDIEAQYRRNLEQYQSASVNKVFFGIQILITFAMFYALDIAGLIFSYQYKTDCGDVKIRIPPSDFSASQIMRWNAWAYIIGITFTFIVMAINPKLNNLGGLIIWFIIIWSFIFSIAGIAVWNSDEFDDNGCKKTEFGKMLLAFSVIKLSFYGLACCCVCIMSFSIMAAALANQ
mmetsp:Transcript_23334/g.28610  ORF Transcript_23334/g.28610 Transcript_23334/m.28610 type:complete len:304 (+) Transcript_23334:49-960(+)